MKRALLFGGVPVLAGIALIVLWALADKEASRGNDWTQVVATIETATVRAGGIDIAYRYTAGGREHRNPAGHLTLRGNSPSATTRYAAGKPVLAYVNPAAPAESLLEPKPRPSSITLIAGIVLLIIGIPIGVFFLRPQNPTRPRAKKAPVRRPSKPLSRLKPPPPAPRK